jgi:hypothetical protein
MTIKKPFAGLLLCALAIALSLVWGYVTHRRNEYQKAHPKPLPPVFQFTITQHDSNSKDLILLAPYRMSRWKDGQLVVMDKMGKVYFQRNLRGAVILFRDIMLHGKRYYIYIRDDGRTYHIPKISMAAGYAVLLDEHLDPVKEIRLLPHGDITTNRAEGLDLHDIIVLDTNHYIVSAVCQRAVHNIPDSLHPAPGIVVDAPVLEEIEDGRVIWQWDASQYPELYAASTLDNNYADTAAKLDYLHINALFLDPADSNVVMSFRHANQVVKVDRKTGAIIWKLGGTHSDFPLDTGQVFLRQHGVTFTLPEHHLLMLDNGDSATRPYSRVLEFELDEKRKQVRACNKYILPEPFSMYMGSVEKRGGEYLVAGGTGQYLMQFDPATGKKSFELKCNMALFRAYVLEGNGAIPHTEDQRCNTNDTLGH